MVGLSPRFAVLAAFISLASLSTAPLFVGAAVIPRAEQDAKMARSFNAAHLQSAFRAYGAKAVKRYYGSDNYYPLLEVDILRGSRDWKRGETESQVGTIAIVTNEDNKEQGYLTAEKDELDPQPKCSPVGVSEKANATTFALIHEASQAFDNGLKVVTLEVVDSDPDHHGTANARCMGYNATESDKTDLCVSRCDKSGKSGVSQAFGYNETSHDVVPLSNPPGATSATQGSQSVLRGRDSGKVKLRFIQKSSPANAKGVEELAETSGGASPTATLTKTVTVTNAPSAPTSAVDQHATTSANASSAPTGITNGLSSASTSSTSTANGVAPTAGVPGTTEGSAPTAGAPGTAAGANVLDVEVVQASSASTTIANSAAPSSTQGTSTTGASSSSPSGTGSSTNPGGPSASNTSGSS